jgi:transposase-like protein
MRKLTGSNRGVRDPELRFSRVTRWGQPSDYRPDLGPCLLYLGAHNGNGYGQFSYGGRGPGRGNGKYAHRYAWERIKGPIPAGLTVDHLCMVRNCVNIEHLELVSGPKNTQRAAHSKTHCPNGHRYTNPVAGAGSGRCDICLGKQKKRGGLRRTNAYKGAADTRRKYDIAERDRLVIEAVERRMTVAGAAEKLGCADKYMDKLVRAEARRRGVKNRRLRRGPATFDGWTEGKTRVAVQERAGGVCERCDSATPTEMHHRKNRSQQGKWHPANIVHLCALCHVEITAHPADSKVNGFAVMSFQDPSAVPLSYRGQLSRLDDLGYVHPIHNGSTELAPGDI